MLHTILIGMLDICGIALAALVLAHQNFTDDSSKSKGFKREVVVLTHGAHLHLFDMSVS
jgi:hypothetical protein